MNILLIRPDSFIPSAAPPLGLLYLTSYIHEFSSHTVTICDARFKGYTYDQLEEVIRQEAPDIIGITGFSVENEENHEVAKRSKSVLPDVPVVLGGPYVTADHPFALKDTNVDFGVLGEGERSFLNLINALDKDEDYTQVRGLAFRNNGEITTSEPEDFIIDLDELPYPAWDAIELDKYFNYRKMGKRTSSNQHQMKKRVLPIQTTRGCPFRCNYCHNLFGKKLRKRSTENVIGELRLMKEKYGVEEVEVMDDTFNVDLDRGKEIFRRIIEEKFDFKYSFTNGLRADRLDDEILDLFKKAGVYRMVFAIESGTPRIQKAINKNVNLERAKKIIKMATDRKFSVGGFFMLGFLDETEEEVQNTIKFALDSTLHTATFSIMTPFPNTDIWHELKSKGYDISADYKYFSKVSLNISKVSGERLEQLRRTAIKKFYLNPRRVLSILRTTPWRNRFWEKLILLFGVILFNYDK